MPPTYQHTHAHTHIHVHIHTQACTHVYMHTQSKTRNETHVVGLTNTQYGFLGGLAPCGSIASFFGGGGSCLRLPLWELCKQPHGLFVSSSGSQHSYLSVRSNVVLSPVTQSSIIPCIPMPYLETGPYVCWLLRAEISRSWVRYRKRKKVLLSWSRCLSELQEGLHY